MTPNSDRQGSQFGRQRPLKGSCAALPWVCALVSIRGRQTSTARTFYYCFRGRARRCYSSQTSFSSRARALSARASSMSRSLAVPLPAPGKAILLLLSCWQAVQRPELAYLFDTWPCLHGLPVKKKSTPQATASPRVFGIPPFCLCGNLRLMTRPSAATMRLDS